MQVRDITEVEADQLSARSESYFFDRRAVEVAPRKIEKIAVAFANADGGEIVIGIKDDSDEARVAHRWTGASQMEDLNGHLQSLYNLQPPINPTVEFLRCSERSGLVLRLLIEKSHEVHKASDGTVYVRQGAQSLPVKDPQRIMELGFAKGASSFEDQTLPALGAETIVESEEIMEFLTSVAPKMDPLEFCVNQNLIDHRSWEPRVASALLFHPNPSAAIPRKCAVKIARYETREDDAERGHLADQVTVEGPLFELIHEAVETVTRIMSSVSIRTVDGLQTVAYPPEAIWEVLVNAVIHRDYSISDDVQVLIYDNRIEVLSPGRLPGYVNVDNILDARYSRNPKVVRTLNRYPDPPNKDLGEGLNTAFQKMKEWGLTSPEITEDGPYLKVTLSHTPLAKPSELILNFLTKHSSIRNRDAREITGIKSENLVKNEFYKLRDEGLLEMIPELKGAKSAWRLTSAGMKKAQEFKDPE